MCKKTETLPKNLFGEKTPVSKSLYKLLCYEGVVIKHNKVAITWNCHKLHAFL